MWQLDIENVAGIRSGTATLEPGVNAIQASNWQGKTSFLTAIETAVGTAAQLTEGADRGWVRLETPSTTVETELVREDGRVARHGEGYLTDERDLAVADLFAFLGESNDVRRAVREGADLEPLLTRPLDLEDIESQIATLQEDRRRVEAAASEAEAAARDLAARQERVSDLEATLDALREERDSMPEPADDEGASSRDALSEKRAARDRTAQRVEDLEGQLADLEARLEARRSDLAAATVPDGDDLERRLADGREELSTLESRLELAQTVYNANKRVVDEDEVALLADVERGIVDDEFTCWVCGESAARKRVTDRLDALAETVQSLRERVAERRASLEALETEHRQVEAKRQERTSLERELAELESRVDDRRTALADARDRRRELADEVTTLEASVADRDERLTDLVSEIKFTEASLEDAREALEQTEQEADRRSDLAAQREAIEDQLEALRGRQERVKSELHETFEAAMRDVLEAFEPGFERAWLDDFELRVVREGRQVPLDALSEGEVELLGIVVALAGYEAFEVGSRLPVMCLDGLGGLAREHLHRLVTYLEARTEYLVTTAYPEAGDFEGHTVTPADWTVVSDGVDAAS